MYFGAESFRRDFCLEPSPSPQQILSPEQDCKGYCMGLQDKKLHGPFFLGGKYEILSSCKQSKLYCSFKQYKIMSRSILALQRTENIQVT